MNAHGLSNKLGANYLVQAHDIKWHVHALYVMRSSKVVLEQIHPNGVSDIGLLRNEQSG